MNIIVHTHLSPRIIEVLSPTTSVTVQEIVDAIRDWEDDNLSFDQLLSAAGKEALGGGVTVGITATLQNARLMFTGRTTPLESAGTCTTNDPTGKVLHATGGQFVTNGIYKGCTVKNHTTGSMATVTEIISEIELKGFQLTGGSRTTWLNGDTYDIYPNVQCAITGGNLVAVDSVGAELSPVIQSPNVQVIRSSSSSATLQELSSIQYSSFNGGVTVDIINGVSGIKFPIGTIEQPVDNIPDAVNIANDRGFNKIFIIGDITFSTGDDLDDFSVLGESPIKSLITIESAALVAGTEFLNAQITGVLDGNNTIKNCKIGDLLYVEGYIQECLLEAGTITLGGSTRCDFLNCWSGSPGVTPVIDMGGSGRALGMRAYSGGVKIINKNGDDKVAVDLISGYLILDATVTAGEIAARGVGNLIDNSTGTVTVDDGLLSQKCIADSVWDEYIIDHIIAGSFGDILARILATIEIRRCSVDDSSATTTKFNTTLTEINGFWGRSAILFTSGNNKGIIRGVKSYKEIRGEIQLKTPLSYTPVNGDKFVIIPARKFLTPDVLELAGAVWDDMRSGHEIVGSFGAAMTDIHDESFGKWILNPVAKTLILYKADGVSVLKVFDLTDTGDAVPAFIGRTPQ